MPAPLANKCSSITISARSIVGMSIGSIAPRSSFSTASSISKRHAGDITKWRLHQLKS